MTHFVRLFVNNKHQLSESEVPYSSVLESEDNLVYEFQHYTALTEKQADDYAEALSDYLLESGIDDFDIEISMSEKDSLAEEAKIAHKTIAEDWRINVQPILEENTGSHYMGAYAFNKKAEKAIKEHKRFKEMLTLDEITLEEDEDFHELFGYLGYVEEAGIFEAKYRGRTVKLNKPMRGDVKKFKVYVNKPGKGGKKRVVKVNFGHGGTSAKRKTMRIRKNNPAARRSFRARHNCDNPGPKWKARYWSCRKWQVGMLLMISQCTLETIKIFTQNTITLA